MQVLRDVRIITFPLVIVFHYWAVYSTMAVSNLEQDSAIMQASQQLGYQNTAIKSFMEGRDLYISLPTGSGTLLSFSVLPYAFDYLSNASIVSWWSFHP